MCRALHPCDAGLVGGHSPGLPQGIADGPNEDLKLAGEQRQGLAKGRAGDLHGQHARQRGDEVVVVLPQLLGSPWRKGAGSATPVPEGLVGQPEPGDHPRGLPAEFPKRLGLVLRGRTQERRVHHFAEFMQGRLQSLQ